MSWIGLHKFADAIFGITQNGPKLAVDSQIAVKKKTNKKTKKKTLYITLSSLVR